MILHNGIKYTIRGSSEDNGQFDHYFYTKIITNTYNNIIYKGYNAVVTKTYTAYFDEDTDQLIKRDYFSWTLRYNYKTRGGVCTSPQEEEDINNIIDNGGGDSSSNGDDDNGSGNDGNGSGNDSGTIGNNSGDNPDDPNGGGNNSGTGDDKGKGLFDDTSGSRNDKYNRSQLPLGADIQNPDILGFDPFKEMSPNAPRENNLANKGTTYPIIRINDHYFLDSEIVYFSMETGMTKNYYDYQQFQAPISGFLPTMKLIITTSNPGMLKQDYIKNGDRCAVFFSANHGMVKSMRCDFRIINVVSNRMDQNRPSRYSTQIITGELYVPDLRNEEIRYNFNGSSRDAMMDIAKRLRLSFFFCDPDDTNDVMVWCNCKTPEMFIHDLTTHAWKNPDSFFESWIDPRYGLSFLNINRLLGETGYDEPIDATLWINTFLNNRAADGKAGEMSAKEKIAKLAPQYKIFTNIPSDEESATVYHINSWKILNKAQAIQDFVGLNCKQQYESINPGLQTESQNATAYSVDFSLCLNRTKFNPDKPEENSFYVLLGPARNKTYASGDDVIGQNETEASNTVDPEKITNQQSDGDAEMLLATDGNMMSSGNTHKFYEVAYEHNMRNVLQLQKQIIQVVLNGANLTIVRGEKMPMMLMDLNKVDSALRSGTSKTQVQQLIYEAESGWFIIDGIEWIYDPSEDSTGTCWRTKVNLTRREWPIPGKDNTLTPKDKSISLDQQLVLVNIGNNTYVKMAYKDALYQYGQESIKGGVMDEEVVITGNGTAGKTQSNSDSDKSSSSVSSLDETGTVYLANGKNYVLSAGTASLDMLDQIVFNSDKVASSPIPLTGLKNYMKDIYRAIAEESDNKIKLVSARRWAVDQYGNKIDGNAFIIKNGYYKCINAIGDVMYFKSNNSRHLYGEAIDIINNGIDFTELMTTIIMKKPSILQLMYDYGVSAYIEQAKDDTGTTTKHYHIGTDTIKQKEFWASVKAINGSDKIPGTMNSFANYLRNNKHAAIEITREQLDERLINSTTETT